MEALRLLRGLRGLNLIGGDVVEVAPPFDQTGNTALVGASMMFEILCLLAESFSQRKGPTQLNVSMGALRLLRFALPSILGFSFSVSGSLSGSWTIPMSVLSDAGEQAWRQSALYRLCVVLISALLSVYYSLVRQENSRHSRLEQLFTVTPLWLALRVIGAISAA